MLRLTRKQGEQIRCTIPAGTYENDTLMDITVHRAAPRRVELEFNAPTHIKIMRSELLTALAVEQPSPQSPTSDNPST